MEELREDGYPDDLTGMKFGKLTVDRRTEGYLHRGNGWTCICECGRELNVPRNALVRGDRKSCGECRRIYNDCRTRFGFIYNNMKQRCYNPNATNYDRYGGRGIKVCARWREAYANFHDDMYESYIKHCEDYGEAETTLDRIDPKGDYCLENCRWATRAEQVYNRSNTTYVVIDGTKVSLAKYCQENNLSYVVVRGRISRGWDIEDAINAPKGTQYKTWLKMKENNKNSLDNSE